LLPAHCPVRLQLGQIKGINGPNSEHS
jgi:hypothetical protein